MSTVGAPGGGLDRVELRASRGLDRVEGALRTHIDQQIAQVEGLMADSASRVTLALKAADELELSRLKVVEEVASAERDNIGDRLDKAEGDLKTALTTAVQGVATALEGARREQDITREATKSAVDRVETSMRTRIDEGDTRLREHINAQYGQIAAALDSARREAQIINAASESAIAKAETANEKRFDSVNEFRAQLSDQASLFIPREVAESQFSQMAERIRTLELARSNSTGERDQERRGQDRESVGVGQMIAIFSVVVALFGILAAIAVGAFT